MGVLKNKKKIFITTNGCPSRSLDSARLENYFRANNCIIVKSAKPADYIIFVTCSFRKLKEERCLKQINEFLKYRGKLIVAGCLPDIAPNRLKEIFNGEIIETRNLEKIDELFDDFEVKFRSIPIEHFDSRGESGSLFQRFISNFGFNKKFFKMCLAFISSKLNKITQIRINIKKPKEAKKSKTAYFRVSSGCVEEHCTYCAVSRATGKLKSKKIHECSSEYSMLLKQGHVDFTLFGDNLGAYGLDCGSNFAELMQSLSEVDRAFSVAWHLDSLHPRWIIKYDDVLSGYIAEGKIKSINCPIQSGSNRILKLMNRHHGIEEITEVLKKFMELQPKLNISTHLIVGFPSETEEDFLATINNIKTIYFNEVTIYPYYDGYDTVASKISDKIPEENIKMRLKKAVDLLQREGINTCCEEASI